MKKILAINGSASVASSNEKLLQYLAPLVKDFCDFTVYNDLKKLPHFDPQLTVDNTPEAVMDLRQQIAMANGVLICTPEYVFSIPSGLKNALEWCVSTEVFSNKPLGIITASAKGEKGHADLQMIMKTMLARFQADTLLLIPGIQGKVSRQGEIADDELREKLRRFADALRNLID